MKIKEITDVIDRLAPKELAEEWDNVGLMTGSLQDECAGVMITLDVTRDVAEQAVKEGCNLIISHHPLIFRPLKNVDFDSLQGGLLAYLIKNNITVYSAHTNLDKAENGINMTLARLLGGKNAVMEGAGALFEVDTTLDKLAEKVKTALDDDTVLASGDGNKRVRKVYVVSGAGASEYDFASKAADAFIAGELKHNQFVDAADGGLCLVEFSHYGSEIIMQDIVCRALDGLNVKILRAEQQRPFRRI